MEQKIDLSEFPEYAKSLEREKNAKEALSKFSLENLKELEKIYGKIEHHVPLDVNLSAAEMANEIKQENEKDTVLNKINKTMNKIDRITVDAAMKTQGMNVGGDINNSIDMSMQYAGTKVQNFLDKTIFKKINNFFKGKETKFEDKSKEMKNEWEKITGCKYGQIENNGKKVYVRYSDLEKVLSQKKNELKKTTITKTKNEEYIHLNSSKTIDDLIGIKTMMSMTENKSTVVETAKTEILTER